MRIRRRGMNVETVTHGRVRCSVVAVFGGGGVGGSGGGGGGGGNGGGET